MSVSVERIDVRLYRVPTEYPEEQDGTHAWDGTTMVLVRVHGGGAVGLGWTYGNRGAAAVVQALEEVVVGADVLAIGAIHEAMRWRIRNSGQCGLAAHAVSAVDVALWDLKATVLDLPLCDLFGRHRDRVPAYGSGGFTNLSIPQLQEQLAGFVDLGTAAVKMKVGRRPEADVARVEAARGAIGDADLYVDANSAYAARQAVTLAVPFAEQGVSWLEEPVAWDDLEATRWVRDHVPAPVRVTLGEYGYDLPSFRRIVSAVDVLQADATRCLGLTGFLRAATLAEAWGVPLSSHCAPALHLHAALAAPALESVELFSDHLRIERAFFDGFPALDGGALVPDLTRPGLGLAFREVDAQRYAVQG